MSISKTKRRRYDRVTWFYGDKWDIALCLLRVLSNQFLQYLLITLLLVIIAQRQPHCVEGGRVIG